MAVSRVAAGPAAAGAAGPAARSAAGGAAEGAGGAAALALAERTGQLAPGYSADLALWDIADIRELPYWLGTGRCVASWTCGKPCHPHDLALAC